MSPQAVIKRYGIALTGGIASGKSHAAKLLKGLGLPVVDADILARKAVLPGSSGLKRLTDLLGAQILSETGALNRKALRERVFQDPPIRQAVEGVIHPEIQRLLCDWLEEEGLLQNPRLWVYEASLIFEKGREKEFREVWVSYCSPEAQRSRLMARDSLDIEQANRAIQSQMDPKAKRDRADFVLDTESPLPEVIAQIQMRLSQLKEFL